MTSITPSLRLIWMAAANPNPLPKEWIQGRVAKRPATLETNNSRESFAVCDGEALRLFQISGWSVKDGGGGIYSLIYPQQKQQELL